MQENSAENKNPTTDRRMLVKKVLVRIFLGITILGCIFFIPAGTLRYWEAWAWMGILFIPMLIAFMYLIKNAPELIERRLQAREKEKTQKLIIKLSFLTSLTAFLLPGFDHRFGWSHVPTSVVVIADICVLAGYLFFFRVLRENAYASRIIEVAENQPVIQTGPYAFVRHPMYVAVLVMYGLSPLALGSWWAMLAIIPLPIALVFRILNEEKVLKKDLPGYREYMVKVKYRLIPFIW
jgi:protein-S-isoprenylcysteine O-methyltransferase Ste14